MADLLLPLCPPGVWSPGPPTALTLLSQAIWGGSPSATPRAATRLPASLKGCFVFLAYKGRKQFLQLNTTVWILNRVTQVKSHWQSPPPPSPYLPPPLSALACQGPANPTSLRGTSMPCWIPTEQASMQQPPEMDLLWPSQILLPDPPRPRSS